MPMLPFILLPQHGCSYHFCWCYCHALNQVQHFKLHQIHFESLWLLVLLSSSSLLSFSCLFEVRFSFFSPPPPSPSSSIVSMQEWLKFLPTLLIPTANLNKSHSFRSRCNSMSANIYFYNWPKGQFTIQIWVIQTRIQIENDVECLQLAAVCFSMICFVL